MNGTTWRLRHKRSITTQSPHHIATGICLWSDAWTHSTLSLPFTSTSHESAMWRLISTMAASSTISRGISDHYCDIDCYDKLPYINTTASVGIKALYVAGGVRVWRCD